MQHKINLIELLRITPLYWWSGEKRRTSAPKTVVVKGWQLVKTRVEFHPTCNSVVTGSAISKRGNFQMLSNEVWSNYLSSVGLCKRSQAFDHISFDWFGSSIDFSRLNVDTDLFEREREGRWIYICNRKTNSVKTNLTEVLYG